MYNKKVLSTAKKELTKAKAPKKPKDIITDPMGQWKYPGLPTRIPGNDITMEGVGYPVMGVANTGQRKIMLPGADYTFPGADYVDEYPQMKRGGTRKRRKTKSLSGTNKLMLPNPLLRNYKNRVYDPNVDYFQKGGVSSLEGDLISKVIMERNKDKDFVQRAYALGENPGTPMFNVFEPNEFGQTMSHKMAWGEDEKGQTWMFPTVLNPKNEAIQVPNQYADYISNEGYKRATGMIPKHEYIETELTPKEIEEYRKGGYIVEDISVPELTKAQKGGESKVILTKEHTDKKGNKTIVVTKDDGTKYTKVISKDGKVYNNTQAGLSPEMKEYYKKKADWENKSSGVAQPVDDFWTLPIGMTSAGVKGAAGLAKGLTSLGRNAAKSSLVQAGKAGFKKSLIKSLPGSSINNLAGSGFAGSALTDVVTGKVAEPWKKANKSGKGSDYIDAVSENMLTALDAYPLYNTASKGLKHLAKLDKMHLPLENTHSILPEGMYKSGIGGMDMSRYEVKNPDFYTQMLNTYSNKVLSPTNKKFYSNLIETIKKQNGLVTERQYNELQRLKSGNFNFGKKAYKAGGIVVDLTEKEIQDYIKQGYIVEDVE